jgi:uncharacterized protein YyaL (SSP411 family)
MSNRLGDATSPYLLQHAGNPVDWYPWGKEALEEAITQDKPIFLSIGYAACHWCHVMAHESFENEDTAALLNRHFINIKVDREERPDIDIIYMDAVVSMTGQGGWPLSVFLTPQGEPFYGGTYFPPTARQGLPAFRQVLQALAEAWRAERGRVLKTGAELARRIRQSEAMGGGAESLTRGLLDQAAAQLFCTYDWTYGGWGSAPKFPQAMPLDFLLRRHHRTGDRLALDMVHHALRAMASGGIFDQIGGGFHRYTTDRQWLVPHFEKMLYDNALLAQAYLHAWLATGESLYRSVCEHTLDFMLREMRRPGGGMASSLDADSEGVEGKYYVWSEEEIRRLLEASAVQEAFLATHGVTADGNFDGASILHRPLTDQAAAERWAMPERELAETLRSARETLLTARSRRTPPALDDKVISEWNGLALRVLAEAGGAFGHSDYVRAAQDLAAFAVDNLVVDGRARRAWRRGRVSPTGYLADQASLGQGLLAMYQTDCDPRWFQAAEGLAQQVLEHFADPDGGFYDTPNDGEALIARPKSVQDNASPSGNSLAVGLLLHLHALTGDARLWIPAEAALQAMAGLAGRHPGAFAGWMAAVDTAIGPQLQLALVGDLHDPAFVLLKETAHRRYLPRMVQAAGDPNDLRSPQLLHGRHALEGRPTAYLCQGFSCQLPTTSPDELSSQIARALASDRT